MKTSIAILGAGGKMGLRVTKKLQQAGHDVRAVEIGDAGLKRLKEANVAVAPVAAAVSGARVIVVALPDNVIGKVIHELSPSLVSGTMILILDAAAPYGDALPKDRPDLTFFVGHPCHPPLFNDESDPKARFDFHGGVAKQSIVCALMQGPESEYAVGEAVCRDMWAPILRVHRVTVEQLAILEPGLSEMVAMPFVETMVEAVDECAAKYGIAREAAFDFMIGHLNVEIAMWFGFSPKVPSDAALRLMRFAKSVVVKDTWREALSPAKVKEASELIINT